MVSARGCSDLHALFSEESLVVCYAAPGREVVRLTDAVQQRLLLRLQLCFALVQNPAPRTEPFKHW